MVMQINVVTYRLNKENNVISFATCVYLLEYVLVTFFVQLKFLSALLCF